MLPVQHFLPALARRLVGVGNSDSINALVYMLLSMTLLNNYITNTQLRTPITSLSTQQKNLYHFLKTFNTWHQKNWRLIVYINLSFLIFTLIVSLNNNHQLKLSLVVTNMLQGKWKGLLIPSLKSMKIPKLKTNLTELKTKFWFLKLIFSFVEFDLINCK